MATENDYIGITGKRHDSISEARASFFYAKHGFIPCDGYLPGLFYDKNGESMPSKGDYYHPSLHLYLEHKAANLNGVTTKAKSRSQLAGRANHRGGKPWRCDELRFGWNHSKASKAIIQSLLTPLQYIVVFEKPISAKQALEYMAAGIVFCTMKSLPSYLLKVRLARLGLHVPFNLHYEGNGTEGMKLALGVSE
jgi:hypothetical protein